MEWRSEDLRTDGDAPIAAYGAIGDGRTAALVAADGAIDWLCLPRFDAPPTFGALLDARGGGHFVLAPREPFAATRRYLPDTNVLETTFATARGRVRVVDALAVTERMSPWTELIRVVHGEDGDVPMHWTLRPRSGWAARAPSWQTRRGTTIAACEDGLRLATRTWDAGHPQVAGDALTASFTASPGGCAVLCVQAFHEQPLYAPQRDEVLAHLDATIDFWRTWLAPVRYDGRAPEAVRRSALALGLCLHRESGALVAAPTTSLPEIVGGQRNYDYRACWIRDTALALDAFASLGLRQVDHTALAWVLRAAARTHPRLSPCFTLDADPLTTQRQVDVPGWRASRPVLEGNSAGAQLQLGSWGDLLSAAWRYVDAGNLLDDGTGTRVAELADHVLAIWRNADAGMWEMGDDLRDWTRTKAAVWQTLELAVQLHDRGELPSGDPAAWSAARDEIAGWIRERCWSEERRTFLADGDGSGQLDAANLLLGRMGLASAAELSGTVDAIRAELGAGGPLLWRTTTMRGQEGAFAACSFWLAEALAGAGRADEGREVFDAMLEHRNDLGLLSEEVDPDSGALLGNMPQGLSHLALIRAAVALS